MYIPTWVIVVAIIVFWIYHSRKQRKMAGNIFDDPGLNVEKIEESVRYQKENMIFSLEHFDSPHFIDIQDAFDVMEINYLRLKQRFSHNSEKIIEIAKDWYRYVGALGDMKSARVMLDVDMSDKAFDNLEESMKEPEIIKDEIEKKFRSLLGADWQEIPPDYFKRMETMEKPDKKTEKGLELGDSWKYYYRNSSNLYKLEKERLKAKEKKKEDK